MRLKTLRFPEHDVAVQSWHHSDSTPAVRRILCFPYSGGSSTVFRPLAHALGPGWRVDAVNPPGHGLGAQGPVLERVDDLIATYSACLPDEHLDGTVLLGFSLGGYVAHALALALARRPSGPRPRGMVLCSVPPYGRRDRRYSHLGDDELFDGLESLGGIPRTASDARSAFSMFAHVVRGDFRAYETCPVPEGVLQLPTLVVAGSEDPIYRPEWLDEWRPHVPQATGAVVAGPHVFLSQSAAALAAELESFHDQL